MSDRNFWTRLRTPEAGTRKAGKKKRPGNAAAERRTTAARTDPSPVRPGKPAATKVSDRDFWVELSGQDEEPGSKKASAKKTAAKKSAAKKTAAKKTAAKKTAAKKTAAKKTAAKKTAAKKQASGKSETRTAAARIASPARASQKQVAAKEGTGGKKTAPTKSTGKKSDAGTSTGKQGKTRSRMAGQKKNERPSAAPSLDDVVAFLNRERVRCTYGAVAGLLGVSNIAVGRLLGDPRPEVSWVVNKSTGEPTGYDDSEKHPELKRRKRIISSADALRRAMRG